MNIYSFLRWVKAGIFFMLTLVIISSVNASDFFNKAETHLAIIKAEPCTGPNSFLGKPLYNFGFKFGWPIGNSSFRSVGAFNPNGEEALPLTPETEHSAILATFVDPNFITVFGIDPEDIDPADINVPIHEVKTLTEMRTSAGVSIERDRLPGMFNSNAFQASISAPNNPITLGDWLKAEGTAIIDCDKEGHSVVTIRVRNLLPNRIYTIWSINASAELGLFNWPLGGAASAIATDENGNGEIKRELNFCPLRPVSKVQAEMLFLMVVLHSDHRIYGGAAATNSNGLLGGTISHAQLHIPLAGKAIR